MIVRCRSQNKVNHREIEAVPVEAFLYARMPDVNDCCKNFLFWFWQSLIRINIGTVPDLTIKSTILVVLQDKHCHFISHSIPALLSRLPLQGYTSRSADGSFCDTCQQYSHRYLPRVETRPTLLVTQVGHSCHEVSRVPPLLVSLRASLNLQTAANSYR